MPLLALYILLVLDEPHLRIYLPTSHATAHSRPLPGNSEQSRKATS